MTIYNKGMKYQKGAVTLLALVVVFFQYFVFCSRVTAQLPPLTQPEVNRLLSHPYDASIESRFLFLTGLYRQIPNLFQDSSDYGFNLLELLQEQSRLLDELNLTAEFGIALQNRPAFSEVLINTATTQGTRVTVPIRGEIPGQAISELRERLNRIADLIQFELDSRVSGQSWSREALWSNITTDLAAVSPQKPNPGQIIAALQSTLTPEDKSAIQQIKGLDDKLAFLEARVDPAKVSNPAVIDPTRLRLGTVFSVTPTLQQLIIYCRNFNLQQANLRDKLTLFALLSIKPGPVLQFDATKLSDVKNTIAQVNQAKLEFLSDKAEVLSPVFKNVVDIPDSERIAHTKTVGGVLTEVFDKAPTKYVELSPALLTEQPAWTAILRGFVSGDCSSQRSFGFPNDPGERTFFISDPATPKEYKGLVTATTVVRNGVRSLYIVTIHGPKMSPATVYSVIYGLDQVKAQLGYSAIVLPTDENLVGFINREDLLEAAKTIASNGPVEQITYEHQRVRNVIEGFQSNYNDAKYDHRHNNTSGRRFVPDPKITASIHSTAQAKPLLTLDMSVPDRGLALQLFLDVLISSKDAPPQELIQLRESLAELGKKWGFSLEAIEELIKYSSTVNPQPGSAASMAQVEQGFLERVAKILDTPSTVLPRGELAPQTLHDQRISLLSEAYTRSSDFRDSLSINGSPQRNSSALDAKVHKQLFSDFRTAIRADSIPGWFHNQLDWVLDSSVLTLMESELAENPSSTLRNVFALLYRSYVDGRTTSRGFRRDWTYRNMLISELGIMSHEGLYRSGALPNGALRARIDTLVRRYEIKMLVESDTVSVLGLIEDIQKNGRSAEFFSELLQKVRDWRSARHFPPSYTPSDIPDPGTILHNTILQFREQLTPNWLELARTELWDSKGGKDIFIRFLQFLDYTAPLQPTVDWYIQGFLSEPNTFKIYALNKMPITQAVWDKVLTMPLSEIDTFLTTRAGPIPEVIIDRVWGELPIGDPVAEGPLGPLRRIVGVPGFSTRMPPSENRVMALVEAIAADRADVDLISEVEGLPEQLQRAIVRRFASAPSSDTFKAVERISRYQKGISEFLFSALTDYMKKNLFTSLDELHESPPGVYEISAALQRDLINFIEKNQEKFTAQQRLVLKSRLVAIQIDGSVYPNKIKSLIGHFAANALEATLSLPSGRRAVIITTAVVGAILVATTLSAAELGHFMSGDLAALPERVQIFDSSLPGVRPGLTLEVYLNHNLIETNRATGIRTVTYQNLYNETLRNGIHAGSWSFDPRNPLSIGDAVALPELFNLTVDPRSQGSLQRAELRSILSSNLRVPTTPAEVVVRGSDQLTRSISDASARYGGEYYTGAGTRVIVLERTGATTVYPTLEPTSYSAVIGDNLGYVDPVRGTPAGTTLQQVSQSMPQDVRDVYNEYNRMNPLAGNAYAREAVGSIVERFGSPGSSPAPTTGGLRLVSYIQGSAIYARSSSTLASVRSVGYDLALSANVQGNAMLRDLVRPHAGFGMAGMIGSFMGLEFLNGAVREQTEAIASGNWDRYDNSYLSAGQEVQEHLPHMLAGIAAFEAAGVGVASLEFAGFTATAAAGGAALSATGVGFVALMALAEIEMIGQTETLLNQLDDQAKAVSMESDEWAYSDNPFMRQLELERELAIHMIGGAWNSIKNGVSGSLSEMVNDMLGSPDGKVWAFDSSFESAHFEDPSSSPNIMPPYEALDSYSELIEDSPGGEGQEQNEALFTIPQWLEDLSNKGEYHSVAIYSSLSALKDIFPSLIAAPTARGKEILTTPVAAIQRQPIATRLPGILERMEDAIRALQQQDPSVDRGADESNPFVYELGADPQAWIDAFQSGQISMRDLERAWGRMSASRPQEQQTNPIAITGIPSAVTVLKGQTITLRTQATGDGLHFVWTRNGEPLMAWDDSTLTIPNAQMEHDGEYVAYVSNGHMMLSTPPVSVRVVGFHEEPAESATIALSKKLTLTARATDGARYQWSKNGAPIEGATRPTLEVRSFKASDVGVYAVTIAVDRHTVTSRNSLVHLIEFIKTPGFRIASVASLVTNVAEAKVTHAQGVRVTPAYQWYKDGVIVAQQVGPILNLSNIQKAQEGKYSVQATYGDGVIESPTGHLAVIDRVLSGTSLLPLPSFRCSVETGGRLGCTQQAGISTNGELVPGAIPGATYLSLGARHGCAVNAFKRVSCWGSNLQGQRTIPADIASKDVTAVSVGSNYSCALLQEEGTVKCWGSFSAGQITPGVNQVISLTTNSTGTCAITLANDRLCWGP